MSDAVLDASALLALIFGEPGADKVADRIASCVLSTVNLSEVAAKMAERGTPPDAVRTLLDKLPCRIVPLDREIALAAAALRPATRGAGLSLGDRVCLAHAEREGVPALTADQGWRRVALPVAVEYIR
jgi:ribonuclease VapC